MAEVSFAVSTVGLVIPFALIDPLASGAIGSTPISNAVAVTSATWVAQSGKRRPLTLSQAVSATFTYVVSAGDSRFPHIETGILEIAFDDNRFWTSSFAVNVYQHF